MDGDANETPAGDETPLEQPTTRCDHEPTVGYAVGFDVREDVDEIESACSMHVTVTELPPDDPSADAVGCDVAGCDGHHETVATELRRTAARHTGNVTCGDPPS